MQSFIKSSKWASLVLFLICILPKSSLAQTCQCDSMVESRRLNWSNWVKNSDSIKIVQVVKKGTIKTEKSRQRIIKLLNSDTAWIAYPVSGKTVTVQLGRLDTLAGRMIRSPDPGPFDSIQLKRYTAPGDFVPMRVQSFGPRNRYYEFVNENIDPDDEYYEIYFSVGGKIIMSPGVCDKHFCTLMDNIIYHLFITK